MRIKSLIISLILAAVLATGGILLYCYWPAIVGTINDSSYYTSEQVQEAYDKGYDDAFNNKSEMEGQIEYYKGLTDEYYLSILEYQRQVENLNEINSSSQAQIESLQSIKSQNESTIADLTQSVSQNEETIKGLNSQISSLQDRIKLLENEASSSSGEIASLRQQITNLQTLNTQLQATNQLNLQTIQNLNNQVKTLNAQITELTKQSQSNTDVVNSLNSKIAELQKSIEYYESYIQQLEQGDQIVITFEFNGSVYNIQILQKNGKVSIVNPESTRYVVFNYWTVDGEQINLNEYTFVKNTKVVANVTYKYDVKFTVDNEQYKDIQLIEKNQHATVPENPSKDGYEFDGWTINGVDIVDVNSYDITQNITFVAKFTKVHDVKFMYGDSVWVIQHVRNGGYATDVYISNTDHEIFNGWKLNGVIVNVTEQQIVADTIFVADVTYKYDVKFMVDDQQFGETQIVEQNGYASLPETDPSKDKHLFVCWTINGNDSVNVATYAITQDTTFVAKFEELPSFADASWLTISKVSYEIAGQKMTSEEVWEKYGWKNGDEKTFELTSAEEVTVIILGFNHDDKSDGSGKAGITIGMKNCLANKYVMNSANVSSGGWDVCEMRTNTMVELFNMLPNDLQQVIVNVNKKTSAGYHSTTITISSDKLWFLSLAEIFTHDVITNSSDYAFRQYASTYNAEGEQYSYFADKIGDNDARSANPGLVRYLSNGAGKDCYWRLRSSYNTDDGHFCEVMTNGKIGSASAPLADGISFNFCI